MKRVETNSGFESIELFNEWYSGKVGNEDG